MLFKIGFVEYKPCVGGGVSFRSGLKFKIPGTPCYHCQLSAELSFYIVDILKCSPSILTLFGTNRTEWHAPTDVCSHSKDLDPAIADLHQASECHKVDKKAMIRNRYNQSGTDTIKFHLQSQKISPDRLKTASIQCEHSAMRAAKPHTCTCSRFGAKMLNIII